MALSEHLTRHLLGDVRRHTAAVEDRLTVALDEAHRRWPGVELAPEVWLAWVAARLPPAPTPLESALDSLRLADLYLACACASRDPRALAAFDAAFLAGNARSSDDAKQLLRQKLFVAEPGGPPPRIALYAGRGDLGRWVRAALARLAIDEARAAREVPTEDALMEALGVDPAGGPELVRLKDEARALMQLAFREAVCALSDRERAMLLQFHVDGVGVVALGKLFGLAPSNVSRTLAKARVMLLSQIRRSLLRHKQIHAEELDSLVELVRSQLSLTGDLRG